VAQKHPAKAAQLREWSPAAREGTLKWLENAMKEKPAVTELE